MAESTTELYNVVINDELQYSIWPTWKENAPGWRNEGKTGTKEEVLAYIDEVWTDMRPLSLRNKMDEWAKNAPKIDPETAKQRIAAMRAKGGNKFREARPPNALVKKLMTEQKVTIIRYREQDDSPSLDKLKEAIRREYVLVKFTETTGGTEIGVNIAPLSSHPSYAKVDLSETTLKVTGRAKLDYCPILIHATVDLKTFQGTGHVEVCEDWAVSK